MTNQERVEIIIDNLINLLEDDLPNIEYSVLDKFKFNNIIGTTFLINGLSTKSIFFPNIIDSNFEVLVFNQNIEDGIEPHIHYKNDIENRFKIEEELVEILKDENEGLDLYRYNKIDR